jgi:hypothetical protein
MVRLYIICTSSQLMKLPEGDFGSSYPPPTTHGSQGLDLVHYFHPSTHWADAWYAQNAPSPPPLQENSQRISKGQFVSRGDTKSVSHAALFSDLSTAWVSVSFSASNPSIIRSRTGQYLPPPSSLSKAVLEEASATYGESIASFAESFIGSGTFCARGECWDLASEALKYVTSFDYIDKPVSSISRTHGHLIFSGKAMGKGMQVGKWRGGDDRVRRGDIVEWRSVRINFVGAPMGSYAILGDPEHTAIITRDSIPQCTEGELRDGMNLKPSAIGSLEVVEQSVSQPPEPKKQEYDMEAFEQGEVWIYRPISMATYLGFDDLDVNAPAHALSV